MKQGIWYNIWCWLRVVNNSKHWSPLYPVSKLWDAAILRNLQDPHFQESGHILTTASRCSVILNGKQMWVSNFPYASCYITVGGRSVVPRRTTVLKFFDTLTDHEARGLIAPCVRGQYGT